MADSTIKPPVQVTVRDSAGNTVTTFSGTIRVAIASDGSPLKNAKLQGDTVATATAGVAVFGTLSIDQVGTGYTLSAALATGGSMGTSASFDVATTPPPPPTTGDLTVGNTTTGSDLDPDGYTVTVDGGQSQPLSVNATITFPGLSVADHTVEISGVASNCTVGGANPRTVSVPAGATAQTNFAITCSQLPPTTGDLKVTTSTGGSNLDPDGYTVAVDGGAGQAIGINASYTFNGLGTGSHTVTLSGVASNCTVSGGNSQTTTVNGGQTASIAFSVTCTATTGNLTVTAATSGSNPPSGYTFSIDGGTSQNIGANANITVSGLSAGSHTVQLSGVPSNCAVSGSNPQTVTVPGGGSTTASFTITCSALTGSLTVTTTTSGSNQPSGYTVTVDGGQSKSIAATGNVSYTPIAATTHSVQLNGVPSNCTVSGANPQTVNVPANGTGQATFTVTCTAPPNQPPVAAFTSSCNGLTCNFTSASSDPDGSIAAYQWTFGDGGTATTQNPSHTYSAGGTYSVQLTVTDNQNATNSVTHSVTVTAPPPPNQPPVAAFTSSCNGLTCNFTSTSSDPDGSITAYQWTFGDGGTATTQNPSHTYSAGGTYNVQLTVTDNQNATNSVTHSVTVTAPPPPNQPPVAAFTSSCSGLTCNFSSTSSDPDGSITGYSWDFGDGGTASSQNPSHGYATGGTYTVTLVVTDNQGATGSVSHSVTVTAPPPPNQPPVVTAGGNQSVLVGALFTLSGASFSDANHNGPWTITIDWGDGSSDTNTTSNEGSISGSHSYVTLLPATYTVTITVTDSGGLSGSASKTVSVTTL